MSGGGPDASTLAIAHAEKRGTDAPLVTLDLCRGWHTANVEGVVTLLEAVRAHPKAHLVHMSTDEVFGSIDEPVEATEDYPFAPSSPYSASKAGAELQIQAYRRTHGMPVTVVRSTNVYGPHQHLEKFIPLFTARAMTREPLPLYGDGLQQREWLHADDLMDAIQAVVRSDGAGSTVDGINIGSGVRHTNLDLARRICDLTERPQELINHVTDRAGHDRRYALDTSRMRALGWEPRTNFDDGFADAVRWYAEHAATRAMADPALADYMKAQYADRLATGNAAAG